MLRFFLSSNLSLSYKIKSMNLILFSLEKALSILFKSFNRPDCIIEMRTQEIVYCDFGFNATRIKRM